MHETAQGRRWLTVPEEAPGDDLRGRDQNRRWSRLSGPALGAQTIAVHSETGVVEGGSDSRKDGCAPTF
jgi:hypothetical protein